jgi:hypothetical protein
VQLISDLCYFGVVLTKFKQGRFFRNDLFSFPCSSKRRKLHTWWTKTVPPGLLLGAMFMFLTDITVFLDESQLPDAWKMGFSGYDIAAAIWIFTFLTNLMFMIPVPIMFVDVFSRARKYSAFCCSSREPSPSERPYAQFTEYGARFDDAESQRPATTASRSAHGRSSPYRNRNSRNRRTISIINFSFEN